MTADRTTKPTIVEDLDRDELLVLLRNSCALFAIKERDLVKAQWLIAGDRERIWREQALAKSREVVALAGRLDAAREKINAAAATFTPTRDGADEFAKVGGLLARAWSAYTSASRELDALEARAARYERRADRLWQKLEEMSR
jgi:hypothetical protein